MPMRYLMLWLCVMGTSQSQMLLKFRVFDAWPGKQIHSHNYRVREPYRDQVVVLIGNAPSAWDISRDIATLAKEVHVASRSFVTGTPTKQPGFDNMWRHSMLRYYRQRVPLRMGWWFSNMEAQFTLISFYTVPGTNTIFLF